MIFKLEFGIQTFYNLSTKMLYGLDILTLSCELRHEWVILKTFLHTLNRQFYVNISVVPLMGVYYCGIQVESE